MFPGLLKIEGPKMLSVPGSLIKRRMAEHIERGNAAIAAYRAAKAEGQGPKVPWDHYIKATESSIRAYADMCDCVADGPHAMSIEQYKEFADGLGDWYTAEAVIRKYDAKKPGDTDD
jgi:hypothetical protein